MSKNQIIVRGGEKSAPLPPERHFDGTPDPEIGRMVAEGAVRYHLDTLRALDAESRAPIFTERETSPPLPFILTAGDPMQQLDEIERVRLENIGREMARASLKGKEGTAEVGEKLDAVLEKGCAAAACRTLKECLCSCKKCRRACSLRRR